MLAQGKVGTVVLAAGVGIAGSAGVTGTVVTGPGLMITGIPSLVAHGSHGFTD